MNEKMNGFMEVLKANKGNLPFQTLIQVDSGILDVIISFNPFPHRPKERMEITNRFSIYESQPIEICEAIKKMWVAIFDKITSPEFIEGIKRNESSAT